MIQFSVIDAPESDVMMLMLMLMPKGVRGEKRWIKHVNVLNLLQREAFFFQVTECIGPVWSLEMWRCYDLSSYVCVCVSLSPSFDGCVIHVPPSRVPTLIT
jgi:predicted phosphatase